MASNNSTTATTATTPTTRTDTNSTAAAGAWVCIGAESRYGARTEIRVHGRYITILRAASRTGGVHALDTTCYHAGGPLTTGPIKHIAKRTCLQCPWHAYLVDIETGEGLYMDLNRRYRSKGVRQRVHDVEERDGQLWVRLWTGGEVASDGYALGPRFGEGGTRVPEFPEREEEAEK